MPAGIGYDSGYRHQLRFDPDDITFANFIAGRD
jgi:hypothetical protein